MDFRTTPLRGSRCRVASNRRRAGAESCQEAIHNVKDPFVFAFCRSSMHINGHKKNRQYTFDQPFHDPIICSAFREVIDAYHCPFSFLGGNQSTSLSCYLQKKKLNSSLRVRRTYARKRIAITNDNNLSTVHS